MFDGPFCWVCFCNFWIARPRIVVCGVVCFGWVLGFSRLSNLLLFDARLCWWVFFVESLILAQDERWRRA